MVQFRVLAVGLWVLLFVLVDLLGLLVGWFVLVPVVLWTGLSALWGGLVWSCSSGTQQEHADRTQQNEKSDGVQLLNSSANFGVKVG